MRFLDRIKQKVKKILKEPVNTSVDEQCHELESTTVNLGELIVEYEELCLALRAHQRLMSELMDELDEGRISARDFREVMKKNVRDTTEVSNLIQSIESKLIALGYRSIFAR